MQLGHSRTLQMLVAVFLSLCGTVLWYCSSSCLLGDHSRLTPPSYVAGTLAYTAPVLSVILSAVLVSVLDVKNLTRKGVDMKKTLHSVRDCFTRMIPSVD